MNFRARGLEGDLGWKPWFCTYWLKSLLIWEENFLPKSALGRRWINDEVLEAVIAKTIRRMSRYTSKIQFQDTFAWMICLNSLIFLGERQPTVMKYVWEKKSIFHKFSANFWPKGRFSRSPGLAASIGIKISGFRAFPTNLVTKTCFLIVKSPPKHLRMTLEDLRMTPE